MSLDPVEQAVLYCNNGDVKQNIGISLVSAADSWPEGGQGAGERKGITDSAQKNTLYKNAETV